MVGNEPLDGPDGLAVVAELAVVVVLDDQAGSPPSPLGGVMAPLRMQRHAQRVLMCRREHAGGDVHFRQQIGPRSIAVHPQRDDTGTGIVYDVSMERQARVFHRDRPVAPHNPGNQRQRLHVARRDDDLLGPGKHAPCPSQVFGKRGSQYQLPGRVAVTERRRRRAGQGTAGAAQPGSDREGGHIGRARPQVVSRCGRPRRPGRSRCRQVGQLGDGGARAVPGQQVTLRGELVVRGRYRAPRRTQLGRKGTGRRQARSRGQPPGSDRITQGSLDRRSPAAGSSHIEVQIHTRSGPSFCHIHGP
jgi:hypothetical protein